jgi:hypothetical protein|tara:strand:- start:933 stop:1106 length:174 start_codon:yes stop_codon:yes gene_type:complete
MSNKTDLVNDLMSTITVMEELWRYHPENKDKVDIVESYAQLQVIKDDIEIELGELGS